MALRLEAALEVKAEAWTDPWVSSICSTCGSRSAASRAMHAWRALREQPS